jgi:hypothetical protein
VTRKIPPEAYSFYLGLGLTRSYEAVAKHYGTTKRSVTKCAARENWQAKIKAAEETTRSRAEEKAQETLEEMNERHLKTVQLIQRKALEALRTTAITSGIDAAKALVMAVEKERLIRGEPTDRTAVDVETLIKREYQELFTDDTSEEAERRRYEANARAAGQ